MKGITAGLNEARSDVASVKYQGYLTAGVERWREYRDQLKPLGKKPVLFEITKDADAHANYPDYAAAPAEPAGRSHRPMARNTSASSGSVCRISAGRKRGRTA